MKARKEAFPAGKAPAALACADTEGTMKRPGKDNRERYVTLLQFPVGTRQT
jgi:hypothetical protein